MDDAAKKTNFMLLWNFLLQNKIEVCPSASLYNLDLCYYILTEFITI